jgi:HPt (histidine-containing phosphotransfer) domain-containing protein
MNLEKCYKLFGGDLEDAQIRLASSQRVEKFMLKFVEAGECSLLEEAVARGDFKDAFMKAHDIKGTSANLGFTALFESSSALCEALRDGEPKGEIAPLLETVCRDNKAITDAVRSVYG